MEVEKPGIQNFRFVDINKMVEHCFPQQIHNIGFSVTLLHNHSHAPINSFLIYSEDFNEAEYFSQNQFHSLNPCSWYLNENNTPVAYEFSSKQIAYDQEIILKQLETLNKMGYVHYGVTNRPIENKIEVQTKSGHKYYQRENFKLNVNVTQTETVTNGKKMDACYAYTTCVRTFMQCHVTDYGHDVY